MQNLHFFSTGVAKFNIKKERSTIFLQLFFKFLILCRFILTLNLFRVVYVLSPKGGKWGNTSFMMYMYIYNIRTLSVNIKFICTSFRNRQNSEPLASFSGLFRSEYEWILYLTTMYVYCVYPAMSKMSENLSDLNKNEFILQSVHLLYKYAIRIHFCFIRTRRINFSAYE